MMAAERSLYDEQLRHVVAGMLSTTNFIPALMHPEEMLNLADHVIHHIRLMDQASQASAQAPGEIVQQGYDIDGPSA